MQTFWEAVSVFDMRKALKIQNMERGAQMSDI